MAANTPFDYSRHEHDSVLVYDLSEWDGDTDTVGDLEDQWAADARQSHISGTVTVFGPDVSLGRETQEHLAREWSANVDAAGVERIAFVADGVKAHAVSANMDVEPAVHAFGSREDAIEWAQG
ncbi:hypothetical protein [Halobaculum lipolyticum]|uniref:SpoIIAA-like n=1 Tax=Halobaculum lipolyticum TaxID=3032001 RepID=A0ABD5WEN8_9EURY|nr:hypothetical protein [Halobaculum sp. DT31]